MLSLLLITLFSLTPAAHADQSIGDLPEIGQLMVDHFDCNLQLVLAPNNDSQDKDFRISGSQTGQQGDPASVTLGPDTLSGSANSQLLELEWRRGGKLVASATTMIQVSTTKAYVLIVSDPANEGSQASLSCTAVTFADLKKAQP